MIRAGELDRKIVIVRQTSGTKNEFNEPDMIWQPIARLFAQFRQTSGREFFAAGEVLSERKATFILRWRSDLLMTDRIQYSGIDWLISEIREIGRREGLELQAYTRPN